MIRVYTHRADCKLPFRFMRLGKIGTEFTFLITFDCFCVDIFVKLPVMGEVSPLDNRQESLTQEEIDDARTSTTVPSGETK